MIRRLLEWLFGEFPDPAWRATGIKQTCPGKYDASKALASKARAEKSDVDRMKLAAKRAETPKPKSNVLPLDRLAQGRHGSQRNR